MTSKCFMLIYIWLWCLEKIIVKGVRSASDKNRFKCHITYNFIKISLLLANIPYKASPRAWVNVIAITHKSPLHWTTVSCMSQVPVNPLALILFWIMVLKYKEIKFMVSVITSFFKSSLQLCFGYILSISKQHL